MARSDREGDVGSDIRENVWVELIPPEVLEPCRRELGVSDGVLDVLVDQVGLQCPCVAWPLLSEGPHTNKCSIGVPGRGRVWSTRA
jgi:hypothetical protein